MQQKECFEEYKKVYRELALEEARRGFISHLITYVAINLLMIIINLLYSPEYLWCLWMLFFWGMGLVSHYLWDVRWKDRELKKMELLAEHRVKIQKEDFTAKNAK